MPRKACFVRVFHHCAQLIGLAGNVTSVLSLLFAQRLKPRFLPVAAVCAITCIAMAVQGVSSALVPFMTGTACHAKTVVH